MIEKKKKEIEELKNIINFLRKKKREAESYVRLKEWRVKNKNKTKK